MLDVRYDRGERIIFSTSSGFHTVADVRRYIAALHAAVAVARAHCGTVRLLIDATDSQVQSAEVMDEVLTHPTVITQPQDRMALVVLSMLAKMQATRNFRSDQERAFVSYDAALDWLNDAGSDAVAGEPAGHRHRA